MLILFYTANGLNSTQIFTIQAAFHLAVLLLEVPSGYLADVVGRKRTLVLGAFFFPLGLAVYAAGRNSRPLSRPRSFWPSASACARAAIRP